LFFVPYSSALWMAAGFLWIMDASINISMEPFRALVADKLPDNQRSYGFVMQTLIIGIGTWVASSLPSIVTYLGVSNESVVGSVPDSVKVAFGIGAMVFMLSILFTIFTTKEYPPENLEEFRAENEASKGFLNGIKEIFSGIIGMPNVMIKLGVVQFFSWFAFFTMWSMATPALTEHVFNAPVDSTGYNDAANKVGIYMGTYGLASMVYALLLVFITRKIRINRKFVHMVSLIVGGVGFISMYYISEPWMLHLSFACVGVAWASILSMPYAMLSSSIEPTKMGIYMGIFNMFIVIPQVVAAVGGINFGYKLFFGPDVINTMLLAGSSLIIAGLANLIIVDKRAIGMSDS
jgi:maltose/moltooligosaccharide transporter